MTVGTLKRLLECFDDDMSVVFKPENSDYVESFNGDGDEKTVRSFWGSDKERVILYSNGQVGMV